MSRETAELRMALAGVLRERDDDTSARRYADSAVAFLARYGDDVLALVDAFRARGATEAQVAEAAVDEDLRTLRRSLPAIVGPGTAELWMAFGHIEKALGRGIYAPPAPAPATEGPAEPLPAGHPDTWPGGTMHLTATEEPGDLRERIEALRDRELAAPHRTNEQVDNDSFQIGVGAGIAAMYRGVLALVDGFESPGDVEGVRHGPFLDTFAEKEEHLRQRAARRWVDDEDVAVCIAEIDRLRSYLRSCRSCGTRLDDCDNGTCCLGCDHDSPVRAALAAPTPPAPPEGLNVERLTAAMTKHLLAWQEPDGPFKRGHARCNELCVPELAAEYARLAGGPTP